MSESLIQRASMDQAALSARPFLGQTTLSPFLSLSLTFSTGD